MRHPGDAPDEATAHLPVAWRADLRVVQHPEHPFLLAVAHPPASRDPWRWDDGNRLVRNLVKQIEEARRGIDLPVIVAADLNATPTSWRSVHLCRAARLSRGSPRLTLSGTYPSGWPAPLRFPIADFWMDRRVHLVRWCTVGGTESDHLAVRADAILPPSVKATLPGRRGPIH